MDFILRNHKFKAILLYSQVLFKYVSFTKNLHVMAFSQVSRILKVACKLTHMQSVGKFDNVYWFA